MIRLPARDAHGDRRLDGLLRERAHTDNLGPQRLRARPALRCLRVTVQHAMLREVREEEAALAEQERRPEERVVKVEHRVLAHAVDEGDRLADDDAEIAEEQNPFVLVNHFLDNIWHYNHILS